MKVYKLGGILLLSLILVGCGNGNADKSKLSSESKTTMQNSSSASSSSQTSKQAAASSSNAASSSSATTKTSGSQANDNYDFSSLTKQLASQLPGTKLPQASGLSQSSKAVHIRYTGNSANNTIYYSLGNEGLKLNDASIKSESAYAVLSKKTYDSAHAAQQELDYTSPQANKGLPKINLGHSIVGHIQGGAGQQYISWNEGNWSVNVHGSKVNNTSPRKSAKTMAAMFDTYALPAPKNQGTIKFSVGTGQDQTIAWQENNVIYTLKTNDQAVGIRIAASIK